MFLTKKHISRRALLKGAGVSLALPLLRGAAKPYDLGIVIKLEQLLLRLERIPHLGGANDPQAWFASRPICIGKAACFRVRGEGRVS